MFDSPLDFLALVIALVAFIFARKAMNQVAALRAQLDLMQRLATAAAAERSVPPPLAPEQAAEQPPAPSAPGIVPEPPPMPKVEPIAPAVAADATPTAAGP